MQFIKIMQSKIKMKYFLILCITLIVSLTAVFSADDVDNNKQSCSASRRENDKCSFHTYKVVQPLLGYFRKIQNKVNNHDNLIESRDREIRELQVKLAVVESANVEKDKTIEILRENIRLITKAGESAKHGSDQLTALNIASVLKKTQVDLEELKISSLESKIDSCVPFANYPGIHKIKAPGTHPFNVLCGSAGTETGWIVIQQRIDGKEDFYRDWASYKAGFGSFDGDFFLGLEKIYRLTSNQPHELYIHMGEFNGTIRYAAYDSFAIAGEEDQYRLISVDGFSGNTTGFENNMLYHKGNQFHTFDRDISGEKKNAKLFHGGWWYGLHGTTSNLNGKYFDHQVRDHTSNFWLGFYSLKKVQMLIRPKTQKM